MNLEMSLKNVNSKLSNSLKLSTHGCVHVDCDQNVMVPTWVVASVWCSVDGDCSPICYCFFSCISTLNIDTLLQLISWDISFFNLSTDMKESFLILLAVSSILCQDDPCSPNPCGPNTRCMSVNIRKQPVISCECLIGYKYPVGGSQDDGCVEVGMFIISPHDLTIFGLGHHGDIMV